MPAAAVTPAPIAYIKVVAVKKLVVGYLARTPGPPPLWGVCVPVCDLAILLECRFSGPFGSQCRNPDHLL